MHISLIVEEVVREVVGEIFANVLADINYVAPPSRRVRAEIEHRLRERYPGENLKIGLGTVQNRLKTQLGYELYEKHYPAHISDASEQYLVNQADIIRTLSDDPNYYAPKTEEIIESCKKITGENISPPTVHDRFQKQLGPDLYQRHYPKIGAPLDSKVEDFFESKSKEVDKLFNADGVPPYIWEIMDECEANTGHTVSWPIAADRLRTNLGEAKYTRIFPRQAQEIDPVEKREIGNWWLTQADLMQEGKINEIETLTAYQEKIHRDYATISKYGEIALQNTYGDVEGKRRYSDLTKIDRETSAIGFENHQILNHYFQDGFNETISKYPTPMPMMFRESHDQNGNRCDLIISDAYRNNYLQDCLAQRLLSGQTMGQLLGIPPETARRYTDIVVDHTIVKGQLALKEKSKYCDGKTLTIVAYTGVESPDWDVIHNPNMPDIVEVPATTAAKMLQLPEEQVLKIGIIVQLTEERDLNRLKELNEQERARHPNDLNWETKLYVQYKTDRDLEERREAEQRAFEYHRKEQGQQILNGYFKVEIPAEIENSDKNI